MSQSPFSWGRSLDEEAVKESLRHMVSQSPFSWGRSLDLTYEGGVALDAMMSQSPFSWGRSLDKETADEDQADLYVSIPF